MTTTAVRPTLREDALKSLDRLPALSPAVGKVLSRLAFQDVVFEEVEELVSRDTLLCGHILRTVNSAAFARARSVNSVQQAMVLLGLSRLRRIALGFSVRKLFGKARLPPIWSHTRFNLHSAATAFLVESICDAIPGPKQEGAFLAGLLHDLGKLLIATSVPQQYEMTVTLASASGRPLVDCERELLGTDHAELSGLALTKWALPEPICRAVFHHHAPDLLDKLETGYVTNHLWLGAVIQRADSFVNYCGISVTGQQPMGAGLPSIELPGYEYDSAAVLAKFQREWKELEEFFK